MAVEQFRARSGTEIVDATFQLVKANYAPLVTIAAIGSVPALLGALIDPRGAITGGAFGVAGIVFRILYVITVFVMQIALIRTTSDIYLGRPVDIAQSFRVSGTTAARVVGVGIASGLLVFIGLVALVIPGIIAFASLAMAPVLVILEQVGVEPALRRSWSLSKGRRLAILGGMLVFFVVVVLFGALSGIMIAITSSYVMGAIIQSVLMMLLWPLYPAFITLHYYDARIRQEGYDIELLAQVATP
jgi:hypothetical protein